MAKKINIDLKDNDISTFHRLPKFSSSNHPIIIARFTNRDVRNLIGVQDYGIDGMTNLFINENLTSRKKTVLGLQTKLPQNINSFGNIMVIYLLEKLPSEIESKSPAKPILINFSKLLNSYYNVAKTCGFFL